MTVVGGRSAARGLGGRGLGHGGRGGGLGWVVSAAAGGGGSNFADRDSSTEVDASVDGGTSNNAVHLIIHQR